MVSITKVHMSHGEYARKLKQAQGVYLKKLRNDAGLTQADVAKILGYQWPSVVGGNEAGTNNLAPEHYQRFAQAVGVDPQEFVKNILRFHNPWAYALLFPGEPVQVLTGTRSTGKDLHAPNKLPSRKAERPPQPVGGTYQRPRPRP